jgi:hypothetical protein
LVKLFLAQSQARIQRLNQLVDRIRRRIEHHAGANDIAALLSPQDLLYISICPTEVDCQVTAASADVITLAIMHTPTPNAVGQVLAHGYQALFEINTNLLCLAVCRSQNLRHRNSDLVIGKVILRHTLELYAAKSISTDSVVPFLDVRRFRARSVISFGLDIVLNPCPIKNLITDSTDKFFFFAIFCRVSTTSFERFKLMLTDSRS